MDAQSLRALQAPVKARYRDDPSAARVTLSATGTVDPDRIRCAVASEAGGKIEAGLHPAAGGVEPSACSGAMLLEALVGCAGVTLSAVATALEIPIRSGQIVAEGDMDFRGTLGLNKEVPIGLTQIRLRFELDSDASEEQLATLLRLTERYCVVYQTLRQPPEIQVLRVDCPAPPG